MELLGVHKVYRALAERSLVHALRRSPGTDVRAVQGLDLRIDAGEVVGVLGHNGAGKTTMLRLLAGVTAPSAGRVRVAGRITPLISIGVGFHQELSGRENVRVNGSILGLSPAELRSRFDEIVAFAGLDDALDLPVKFYSSGMLLRLAFAVAVHTEPDVLLVDELLAVGDLGFQQKCLSRMAEFREQGVTIVVVSHSVFTVRELCDRAIVLNGGTKVFDGPVGAAVDVHQRLLSGGGADGVGPVQVLDRQVVDEHGATVELLRTGRRYVLRCRLAFRSPVENPHVRFTVYTGLGAIAYQFLTAVRRRYRRFEAGEEVELEVDFVARADTGAYHLTVQVLADEGRTVLAHDVDGVPVRVQGSDDPTGIVDLRAAVSLHADEGGRG